MRAIEKLIEEIRELRNVHAGNSAFAKGIDFGIDLVLDILKRETEQEKENTEMPPDNEPQMTTRKELDYE